ncbi:lytic transglycosylase domain-containing protein [Brucepastera parasyntrophica]|uniref:flagellar assembly lytic transglycosylase n=1 Tax=Brucepastera parasyntrophica TaxID=2880008 RepID=UPI002108D6AF|nr:lytic transglycosylase domain-containing protein [Brucepastera parasyntrophica]ULQ60941.1 lytic transglycosylase domain-containing protein [Brucepastera parasyntrophica]
MSLSYSRFRMLLSGTCFLLFLFSGTSCGASSLKKLSRAELLSALQAGNYHFTDTLSPKKYGDALKFGPEAPYYIGMHLLKAGKTAEARRMFEAGAGTGGQNRKNDTKEPFRTLCMQQLCLYGPASERLRSVGQRLNQIQKDGAFKFPENEDETLRDLHAELLIELGRFDEVPGGVPQWYSRHPLSALLAGRFESLPENYPPEFYAVTAARISMYKRDYQRAWTQVEPLLENTDIRDFLYRAVFSDFGRAALYGSPNYAASAVYFDRLFDRLYADPDVSREILYMLAFYSSRLYGREAERFGQKGYAASSGYLELARTKMETALSFADVDEDTDTAIWYLLNTAFAEGQLFEGIQKYRTVWKNPDFFSDIIDSYLVDRLTAKDFAGIYRLSEILPDSMDRDILARIDYLKARSGLSSAEETKRLFERAFDEDHSALYYRVLSAAALDIRLGAPHSFAPKISTPAEKPSFPVGAEAILRGYAEYHLPEQVYPAAVRMYPSLPLSLARDLAAKLTGAGLHSQALRLSILSLRSSSEPITDLELGFLYPRPWRDEISAASIRFDVPEYLLYALIRTESFFQADAVSHAGAMGLTQMMRPTAGDVARKLRYSEYDLTDPETNITFGAFYLAELIGRLDGKIMPALFAYNAGITRIRNWQRTAGGVNGITGWNAAGPMAGDLFLETIPIAETRDYGRKVLAAAAVYGYLYYQKTTGQIVRELF